MFLEECLFDNVSISMMISRIFCILPSKHVSLLIQIDVTQIGSLMDTKAAGYARTVLAHSLHLIATILDPQKNQSTWAFSLANDASTHYGRSYLNNHIQIHINGKLHNFHLLAIPMYKTHTSKNMFHLIMHVLDIVCPHWRMQLIRVGSDDASSMTGQFQGVVMCLANESANTKFYRVWCGLHQLDLVLKHAYMDLWENEVVDIMKKLLRISDCKGH